MPIIDLTYFQKANVLNIPLSVSAPVANASLTTPDNTDYLTLLIERVEKSILQNALGLATYNELQLALADINNPLYASYKKLVEGDEYDGKVWEGLEYDYSLIAFRIYEIFLTETNERLTGTGNATINVEAANLVTPAYKIANASQEFYKKYQGRYCSEPFISEDGLFIDWLWGENDEVNVSLYRYMLDKKADFPLFDINKFAIYNDLSEKNSFGI